MNSYCPPPHQNLPLFGIWQKLDFWNLETLSHSLLGHHPKGDQSSCSLVGLMLKLKLQYFGHLMWRADSFEKTDAGRDWGQEEKGTTEDETVGWHHRLNGHGFGWTLGADDGQGGLTCCSPWAHKESDTIDWLNWTELNIPHPTKAKLGGFYSIMSSGICPLPSLPPLQTSCSFLKPVLLSQHSLHIVSRKGKFTS